MPRKIVVGMADLNTGQGGEIITTLGLGSCVGLTLFDPIARIGGLAHIMLPKCANPATETNRAKFADTALEDLLRQMQRIGALQARMQAKMAGGAHMFAKVMSNDVIKIGERNAQACRDLLRQLRIPLLAQEVGGQFGRTIELDTQNGELMIKTIGHGIKVI